MIDFFVPGIPAPKGSARAFFVKALGRSVITNANAKTKPWEQAVRAQAATAGCQPVLGAVAIEIVFLFPRPKGHYGAKGLKASAPKSNTKKPDIDKLERALLDALTGVAFVDDSQVTKVVKSKDYASAGQQPGMFVRLLDAEAEPASRTRIEPTQLDVGEGRDLAKGAEGITR